MYFPPSLIVGTNNNAFRTSCVSKIYALGMNKKGCKEGKSNETHLETKEKKQNLNTIINVKKLKRTLTLFLKCEFGQL